jgi:hypothetical protein
MTTSARARKRRTEPHGRRDTDMYFHCSKCVRERLRPNIAVGINGAGTHLQVWCETHDWSLGRFPLKGRMAPGACAECAKTEPHTH